MSKRLTELLKQVSPDVKGQVREARDKNRPVLQDALRAECRLHFRTPDESRKNHPGAQVPVEISDAYPDVLQRITFPGDIGTILLIGDYRSALKNTIDGVKELISLRKQLSERRVSERLSSASVSDLQSTLDWAQSLLRELDERDPLKEVLWVREDILGVYKYWINDKTADDRAVNRARILLYWTVIGLVSKWMGCTVEDLTIVVLTHELAHAYTQLGADIEGRRWPSYKFKDVEIDVKEGLAQYYTDRVLNRHSDRYAGAQEVFKKMLQIQPSPYQVHKGWIEEFTPEAVRRAMLVVRGCNEVLLADFDRRLLEAKEQRI